MLQFVFTNISPYQGATRITKCTQNPDMMEITHSVPRHFSSITWRVAFLGWRCVFFGKSVYSWGIAYARKKIAFYSYAGSSPARVEKLWVQFVFH
jgi:hypothetical protein